MTAHTVTIHATIEQHAAIRAGSSQYGEIYVPVVVGALTAAQRDTLASLPSRRERNPVGGEVYYPTLSAWGDDQKTDRLCVGRLEAADVPGYLDRIAEQRAAAASARQAATASAAVWLAATPAETLAAHWSASPENIYLWARSADNLTDLYPVADWAAAAKMPAAAANLAAAKTIADAASAATKQAQDAEIAAYRQVIADTEAQERRALASIVHEHGTPNQRGRLADGLLPLAEQWRLASDTAFATLSGYAGESTRSADWGYGVDDVDGPTYEGLLLIRRALEAAGIAATAELRDRPVDADQHHAQSVRGIAATAELRDRPEPGVKLHVLATTEWRGLTLHRVFQLPPRLV